MCSGCRMDCVEKWLSKVFKKYGRVVAKYPWPFLIIPVVVCLGLTGGIATLEREDSSEIMYTPTDGEAKNERKLFQEYFPYNDTQFFDSSRKTDLTGYYQTVITSSNKDDKNIFSIKAIDEIIRLDKNITETIVQMGVTAFSYLDICGKWGDQCSGNIFLELLGYNADNITNVNFTYPVHENRYFLGMQLGGVKTDENGYIYYAEAVLLSYYVAYQTEEEKERGNHWLQTMTDHFLANLSNVYQFISPNIETSLSMDDELARATGNIVPLFSIAYTLLMTFAAVSTSMKDWARCKTYVALAGEVSAVLAVGASMGLLSVCGVLYTSTVGTMPFLIVGIGIDNMFVILSSWRHTNYLLSVEERMAITFEKAAVSVTLTSLTNAIAFAIGSYTSFLSIQLFCAYTGVAVVFCYINTITFLAACMVFSGRREAKNLHTILPCIKTTPKEETENRKTCYRIFCTGGDKDMENDTTRRGLLEKGQERIEVPFFSNFLCDWYAPFLLKWPVRIVVIIMYFIYLGFSIWGCVSLQEGLELKNLAPDDSYLIPYYGNYSNYFLSEYGPRVMVAIHEPLDYSSQEISQNSLEIFQSFLDSTYYFTQTEFADNWLRDFEFFLSLPTIDRPSNLTEYISVLQNQFLALPQFDKYKIDLNFSDDNSQIIASRFLVQAQGVENAVQEKNLLLETREIADNAIYQTTGYHGAFIFYDQYIVIVLNTVRNLAMAAACMLLVALFLLPHPLAVLWVTASVISICTGVVGFMVFWDVNLDSISMINLIMCIGFSVDFSGHICYHYTTCEVSNPVTRLQETMKFLGLPIWQGAISTILGVIVLSFSNSYIFRTFFKLIFLVVLFGFLHAMVILPVILPTIGPGSKLCCSSKRNNCIADDTTDLNQPQQETQINEKYIPKLESKANGHENNTFTLQEKTDVNITS